MASKFMPPMIRAHAGLQITGSQHIAIHIKPATVFAHKAAAFVLAYPFASQPETGDKLYFGSVGPSASVLPNLQTQPFRLGFKRQRGGALAGVPCG
jgi:hypothetical protein